MLFVRFTLGPVLVGLNDYLHEIYLGITVLLLMLKAGPIPALMCLFVLDQFYVPQFIYHFGERFHSSQNSLALEVWSVVN